MKKFTSVLAALCLGGVAAMAAPVQADILTHAPYQMTPKGAAMAQAMAQRQVQGTLLPGDQVMTRSYTDKAGRQWDLSVLLSTEKICDMVSFEDNQGNPVTYGFDMLPYYAANFLLSGRIPETGEYDTYVSFTACWPTYYIYEQIFTYQGELENGLIPEKNRDYEAVALSRLANDPEFTQKFKESNYIGEDPIKGTTQFPNWTILENAMSSDGGQCLINGESAITSVTANFASTFTFQEYDTSDQWVKCPVVLYYNKTSNGASANMRVTYDGTARVEGFDAITETLPEFGDIHIFNAGLWDSAVFGDENPFTGPWGPYTALYLCAGDTHLIWKVDTSAGAFNPEAITREVNVAQADLDTYANSIEGYLYGNPTYARDTEINPTGVTYTCIHPFVGEEDGMQFVEIAPELNSFVPRGYNYDTWSEEYGLLMYCHNFPDNLDKGSKIAWGLKDGFRAELTNMYKKTVICKSTGKIIYHYDAADMSKIREYESTGDAEWNSGVEGVAFENATVTAGNGVITVKAVANTPVAIYTLDGVCVANTKVAAGATVEVPAASGLYVVVVEGKASKIVL